MKKIVLLLLAPSLFACTTVEVSSRVPTETTGIDISHAKLVDTPAARLSKPYTFPIQNQTVVTCSFELAEPYYHKDWYPALAIAFSKIGDFSNDVVGEQHVKFSAFFTDATIGRQYEVTTSDNGQSVRTPFMQITDAKTTISLTMSWHEEGYFAYRVKERNGSSGTATVYRPNISPAVATVLVSGVRGNLECGSSVRSDKAAGNDDED